MTHIVISTGRDIFTSDPRRRSFHRGWSGRWRAWPVRRSPSFPNSAWVRCSPNVYGPEVWKICNQNVFLPLRSHPNTSVQDVRCYCMNTTHYGIVSFGNTKDSSPKLSLLKNTSCSLSSHEETMRVNSYTTNIRSGETALLSHNVMHHGVFVLRQSFDASVVICPDQFRPEKIQEKKRTCFLTKASIFSDWDMRDLPYLSMVTNVVAISGRR